MDLHIPVKFIIALHGKSAITQLIWLTIIAESQAPEPRSINSLAATMKTSSSTIYRALKWGAPLAAKHNMLSLYSIGRNHYKFMWVTKTQSKQGRVVTKEEQRAIINHMEVAKKILNYLNQQAEKDYKDSIIANVQPIVDLLEQGITAETIFGVINLKCREWIANEKMQRYLRPRTLFNPEKFDIYRNEVRSESINLTTKKSHGSTKPETQSAEQTLAEAFGTDDSAEFIVPGQ